MVLRSLCVAAALLGSSRAAPQAFLQLHNDPGPNSSVVEQAVEAASLQEQARIEASVSTVEKLEQNNEELQQRDAELERHVAEADAHVRRAEEASWASQEAKALQTEMKSLKRTLSRGQSDKQQLLQEVQKLQKSNETTGLQRQINDVSEERASLQNFCDREKELLKAQVLNATHKADSAQGVVDSLQVLHTKLRHRSVALQAQNEHLLNETEVLRSQKEQLEDALEAPLQAQNNNTAVGAMQEQNQDLRLDAQQLKKQIDAAKTYAQQLTEAVGNEKQKAGQLQEQLRSSIPLPKDVAAAADGTAAVIEALQSENLELQRVTGHDQEHLKEFRGHVRNLEFDKEHLVSTLQQQIRDAQLLKMEMKRQIEQQDAVIEQEDHELVERAKRLLAHNATNVTVSLSSTPHQQGSIGGHRAGIQDPILGMERDATRLHWEFYRAERVAETIADNAPVDDSGEHIELSTTTTTSTALVHLAKYLGAPAGSDVAVLGNQAAAQARASVPVQQDDGIDDLLGEADAEVAQAPAYSL